MFSTFIVACGLLMVVWQSQDGREASPAVPYIKRPQVFNEEQDMNWMIWPKGCKRCGGDLAMEGDVYGKYLACLQCGHVINDLAPQTVVSSNAPVDLPRQEVA